LKKLKNFFSQTGFTSSKMIGPYPGDSDASTSHPGTQWLGGFAMDAISTSKKSLPK